MYYAPP
jgi:uncharacterized protein YukE